MGTTSDWPQKKGIDLEGSARISACAKDIGKFFNVHDRKRKDFWRRDSLLLHAMSVVHGACRRSFCRSGLQGSCDR